MVPHKDIKEAIDNNVTSEDDNILDDVNNDFKNQNEINNHDVELLRSLANLESNNLKAFRHNKPKKAHMTVVSLSNSHYIYI